VIVMYYQLGQDLPLPAKSRDLKFRAAAARARPVLGRANPVAVHLEVVYPMVVLDIQRYWRPSPVEADDLAGVDAFDQKGKRFISLGLQLLKVGAPLRGTPLGELTGKEQKIIGHRCFL